MIKKAQDKEEWQGRMGNGHHAFARHVLKNKKIKTHGGADLCQLNHDDDVNAKPDWVEPGGLHHGQDHCGGQHNHGHAVKGDAQHQVDHREHRHQGVG